MLELVGDDHARFFMQGVSVRKHDFLKAAYVIRVGMGNKVGVDIGDGKSKLGQCLWSPCAAIHEDVAIALDHENVVLEKALRERAARPNEGQVEAPVIF
jgi:hypothetical protein